MVTNKLFGAYIYHDMVPELKPKNISSIRYSTVDGKLIDHHKELFLSKTKSNYVLRPETYAYYKKYIAGEDDFSMQHYELLRFFLALGTLKCLKIVPNSKIFKELYEGKVLYSHRTLLMVKV